jgi:hypothetical protein
VDLVFFALWHQKKRASPSRICLLAVFVIVIAIITIPVEND